MCKDQNILMIPLSLSLSLSKSSHIGGLSRGRRDGPAAVGEEEVGSGEEVEQQHTDY